jgi:hypothetical protein
MDLPYRMFGPRDIDTDDLLFWPNNPRLKISDFSEVRFTEEELLDPKNQKKIFGLLTKHEMHDVHKLVTSMERSGFMRQMAPVVMKVNSHKYLVLEGNRRLAAIRTILGGQGRGLDRTIIKSLKAIPCWLFEHTSDSVPLEAAISRMVAEAHIKGQKPHTKLQQAHMLYNAYEGFLLDKYGKRDFINEVELLDSTANIFGMTSKEIEGEIAVVRLYRQLIAAGYPVPHTAREKLSWVYQNPRLFETHFGYDRTKYQLNSAGADAFYDLFVSDSAAVSNPGKFRKFVEVMRSGRPHDIELLRHEPDELEAVVQRIKESKNDSEFLSALITIEKRINAIRVAAFQERAAEIEAIVRVREIFDKRLMRLIPSSVQYPSVNDRPGTKFKKPACIDEAIVLDKKFLEREIVKTLQVRPNQSCVRAKLPDFLLRRWVLRSRGTPRQRFCDRVDRFLGELADRGVIELYRATNERVRIS